MALMSMTSSSNLNLMLIICLTLKESGESFWAQILLICWPLNLYFLVKSIIPTIFTIVRIVTMHDREPMAQLTIFDCDRHSKFGTFFITYIFIKVGKPSFHEQSSFKSLILFLFGSERISLLFLRFVFSTFWGSQFDFLNKLLLRCLTQWKQGPQVRDQLIKNMYYNIIVVEVWLLFATDRVWCKNPWLRDGHMTHSIRCYQDRYVQCNHLFPSIFLFETFFRPPCIIFLIIYFLILISMLIIRIFKS